MILLAFWVAAEGPNLEPPIAYEPRGRALLKKWIYRAFALHMGPIAGLAWPSKTDPVTNSWHLTARKDILIFTKSPGAAHGKVLQGRTEAQALSQPRKLMYPRSAGLAPGLAHTIFASKRSPAKQVTKFIHKKAATRSDFHPDAESAEYLWNTFAKPRARVMVPGAPSG